MNDEVDRGMNPGTNAAIDAALQRLGSATPVEGLEGRVLTRLAAARMTHAEPVRKAERGRLLRLPLFTGPVLGVVAGGLVAVVIVTGSVSHSRRPRPSEVPGPPALALPVHGLGAASAVQPAAPASAPVPDGVASRGRSARRTAHGRARIAPHAKKAPGVAVPGPDDRLQK